jgi:hypothetical protein
MSYALHIIAGLAIGYVTILALTWLAGKFPIRDRQCSVCDYHRRTDEH